MAARFDPALRGLAARGAATAEINAHPGEADDPDLARFAWGYDWASELAVLVDPRSRAVVTTAGYRLGGFGELAHATRGAGTAMSDGAAA